MESISDSRAQIAPVSPSLPAQTLKGSNVVTTPATEVVPQVTTNRWNTTTKYIVGVGLFLSVVFLIFMSRGSLSMIIFAGLIAFVVRPLIGWFQRRLKVKRGAATGRTYLLVVILLITLPLLLIPPIIDGINYLININYQAVAQNLSAWLQSATVQLQSMPIMGAIFGPLLESLSLAMQDFSNATPPVPTEQVTYSSFTSELARVMHLRQGHRRLHLSAQVRVVEPVRLANAFIGHQ